MKWINFIKKIFVLIAYTAFTTAAQDKHCGTSEVYNKHISEHPEILKKQQELEQFTQEYSQSSKKTEGVVYTIPIVFHILHNYGYENISDEQVIDAVRILNDDFRKLNTDITDVVTAFKGIAADCEIQFRLATKDPDGNCTNGIDRIITPLTTDGGDDSKLNQWAPNKYLNVWVVKSFNQDEHPNIAGYSYFPSSADWNPSIDGVILVNSYVGSIGTGSTVNSRVLTHEIGHYLNLPHPWGYNNDPGISCGDDGVSDTPVTKGWKNCNLTGSAVCKSNVQENVQNYMEYSYCDRMFTQGQKSRMRAALNSSTAQRNNLWTTANLAATGTSASSSSVCAPEVDFNPDLNLVCTGSLITFTDLSWNGDPTSWSWSFPGGTPSTSSLPKPSVQYYTPGVYNVTLIAGNTGGSGTKTKTGIVTVYSNNPAYSSWQYSDSFESGGFPNNDWKVGNNDGGISWQLASPAAADGIFSIMINNSTNNNGQADELVSPSIDLSSIFDPSFHFKVASAQTYSSSNDKLEVYLSKNCGQEWNLIYVKAGSHLSTAGEVGGNFIPTAGQWREEVINLSFYANEKSVYFKFKFTGGDGNNIYIDNVNIFTNGTTGIDEVTANIDLSVFPDPADESVAVSFYLIKEQNVSLKVFDVLGKEVEVINKNLDLGPGEYKYIIQRNEAITSGIYLVKLQIGQQEFYRKIAFR